MAKLLIVDDENDVLEFAANFFRKRKVEVVTASSGEEALTRIETEKPCLVMLDIKMTTMDGIETLRKIRVTNKDLKVIMVSGKKPEEDDACTVCRELGALDYIHKPLQMEELERVVMGILKLS